MPLKKLLCRHKNQFYWMQIIFLSGTKCFWMTQNVNKTLVCHKRFGPAQNILGPVKGQGKRKIFFFNIYSTDWSSLVKHVVMIPLQCRALPFIKGISMGFQYRGTLNIPAHVEYSLNQSPYLREVCLKLETLKINDTMYSKTIIMEKNINQEDRRHK